MLYVVKKADVKVYISFAHEMRLIIIIAGL
jgi:hypothetical protein